jgi:hypothetical protein
MKNLLENWNNYLQSINEISPSWREKPRNFDEETPFGHYGALKNKQPTSNAQQEKNDKFVKYAAEQFDRIFNTNGFYSKKLSTPEQRKEFIADSGVESALAGDIMHGLLHEMLLRYSYKEFIEKEMNLEKYDLWMNIMETIVYYLQNGEKGTNPVPFAKWIVNRIQETLGKKLPDTMKSDELYQMFIKIFKSGTRDRPNLDQIEQIPQGLRKAFLRNIQKALPAGKSANIVNPLEAFTEAISYLINDIHRGANTKSFVFDEKGNDISDKVLNFYNVLERYNKVLQREYGI